VVRGEEETRRQIVLYTILLIAVTLLPVIGGLFGFIYLAAALVLDGIFLALAIRLQKLATRPAALRLYLYSLGYLALLFAAMVVDSKI
jgi:protoheme IX farnesyltransferase